MARTNFGTSTSPSLPALDVNFDETYGIANYLATPLYAGSLAKMWVTSTGKWSVGLSTADWTGGFATFASYANTAAGRAVSAWYANADSGGGAVLARVDFTTAALASFFFTGSVQTGSISTNGTATSFNTTSDRRLKADIADAGDPGALIDAIQVRQFKWRQNQQVCDYGFIAQELVQVAPDAVRVGDDTAEIVPRTQENPGSAIWGVDPSKLVPMLVRELQLLRARVAALEA